MRGVVVICMLLSASVLADPNPEIVRAIADALDDLVGDTVDEGSWNADIIRDKEGHPSEAVCKTRRVSQGMRYCCDFTFLVTPYEGEDLDAEPWTATCEGVCYLVKRESPLRLERNEKSTVACIERLNESPL
jgi:hypothetical protein